MSNSIVMSHSENFINKYCSNCKKTTLHSKDFYNPDEMFDDNPLMVWQCCECNESTDFVV